MYHDDDDLHMCINCHATVVGLENYLSHRNAGPCKQQTPVKENEAPIPVLPPLGIPKSEHIRSIPSATTPSSGDHLNFLNADFFFSSLELQSRRKDAVFEEVMGIEEVLEEEFEERESQAMVHVSGGKWGYDDYVQERDVWDGMEEKGREIGEMEAGRIASPKGDAKKGGEKNVDLTEEREMVGKRSLRASSEMEENNSDFIEGLEGGGDFSIGESSAKCDLASRDCMLATTQSQNFNGPSVTGNRNGNEFSLSLDSCGMEIGNTSQKHDRSYGRNATAPPHGHTRGKWVPGLASEGMRKSGNAVEYFCQPCKKTIRNRRSYETHLSTLCHLKKLMSSSNSKVSPETSEGPRLRSRRLQVSKLKCTSSTASSVNKCSTLESEREYSYSGDLNSQNYLMESLGIKRKNAVSDSKESSCGSMKTGETIDGQIPGGMTSSDDAGKRKTFSSDNTSTKQIFNAKKTSQHRAKRKSKWKKGISKIPKSNKCVSKKGANKRNPCHSKVESKAPIKKKNTKKSGGLDTLNGVGVNVKESKSFFVDERPTILSEDKFLPISDPHLSHGYSYDSLEIQEKQKKLKENIDLVKQRCDSSLLSSSENLQDQMMLGLELMRKEHLLSSSDKLDSNSKDVNVQSNCKDENTKSRGELYGKGPINSSLTPKLVSTGIACGGKDNVQNEDQNVPGARKGNLNNPVEHLVDDEICSPNNEIIFNQDKLSYTPISNHDERNAFGNDKIATLGNDTLAIKDKLPQQSGERSGSFFNSSLVRSESVDNIESMKEPAKMSNENHLSKSVESQDMDSVELLFDETSFLNVPKLGQNYSKLKVVKRGNLSVDSSKQLSSDVTDKFVDSTCCSKSYPEGESSHKLSEVPLASPNYLCCSENVSTVIQGSANCNEQFSWLLSLSSGTKSNSKLLIVKKNSKPIDHHSMKDNLIVPRGQILIIDKSVMDKSENSMLGSSTGEKCLGEKVKGNSAQESVKESNLDCQSQPTLVCECSKSEISYKESSVTIGKAPISIDTNKCDLVDEPRLEEKRVEDESGKHLPKRKSKHIEVHQAMVARNIDLNIGSNGSASEISLGEGSIPKINSQLHHECARSISDDNEKKLISHDLDVMCTDGYPIAHEEVVESSQMVSSVCSSINIVISVKGSPCKSDQVSSNYFCNGNGDSDFFQCNIRTPYSIESSSCSSLKLLPNKLSTAVKLGEASISFNPDESYCRAKSSESDNEKQMLITKFDGAGDQGELCASNGKLISDKMNILASERDIIMENKDGALMYCCRLCSYKSSRHWCVERHIKKHFPRDRHFSCKKCSLSFLTLDNLKQHMKRHKKKSWHCCIKNCSQAFSTKQELLAHISGPHVAEKSFKCHLCDYSGKNLLALIRHKNIHEEQTMVECESCSQLCKKGNLNRHMKRHGKNVLYHCPFCDFTSYYLTSIHRHITRSGLHPNKMMYNCPFCPVVEENMEKSEKMEHSYSLGHSSFSTNNVHEIMDHINSSHKDETTYSYSYSNVTEIIRKIHSLLGIICPSDP